jgi:predicted RNA-binding Zn ribbon-like protein
LRCAPRVHPRSARAELVATIVLREAIARILPAPELTPDADLALLARSFDEAQRSLAVELRGGALAVRPRHGGPALALVRLQAAVSAVALLASPVAPRVRRCADERGCGRLFVDTTRNGSRRYCMAAECGNRARQAAFRARHRMDRST